jgi:hypothetical protein
MASSFPSPLAVPRPGSINWLERNGQLAEPALVLNQNTTRSQIHPSTSAYPSTSPPGCRDRGRGRAKMRRHKGERLPFLHSFESSCLRCGGAVQRQAPVQPCPGSPLGLWPSGLQPTARGLAQSHGRWGGHSSGCPQLEVRLWRHVHGNNGNWATRMGASLNGGVFMLAALCLTREHS